VPGLWTKVATCGIDVKKVFLRFFILVAFFCVFNVFFIFQTFFLFKKNVGKVHSGKYIDKNYFQNNSNEIDHE